MNNTTPWNWGEFHESLNRPATVDDGFHFFDSRYEKARQAIMEYLDSEVGPLVKWMMTTKYHGYDYLTTDKAGLMDNLEGLESVCCSIYNAVVDDGIMQFVMFDDTPYIVFKNLNDPDFQEWFEERMIFYQLPPITPPPGHAPYVPTLERLDIPLEEFGPLVEKCQEKQRIWMEETAKSIQEAIRKLDAKLQEETSTGTH